VAATGKILFERFVYPFELISILLLVAIVGAVMIAKRRLA
jgi:NADH-quinone oxidoreductase subunit J